MRARYDGPNPARQAHQLQDTRYDRKAISEGTWSNPDKANVLPISKMRLQSVSGGAASTNVVSSSSSSSSSAAAAATTAAGDPKGTVVGMLQAGSDDELAKARATLSTLHGQFFDRFHALARHLKTCCCVAELDSILVHSAVPCVRDVLLERLQAASRLASTVAKAGASSAGNGG